MIPPADPLDPPVLSGCPSTVSSVMSEGSAKVMGAPAPTDAPIGLYLHIPFCAHVCPYCDFNTYAGQSDLIPRYVSALEREIGRQGEALAGRRASTIFFGGGTPSLVPPTEIGRLVRACRESFDLAPDVEVTLEANPNSVDAAYFAGLLDGGVNRLSLGVQTQQRRGLRTLGRHHEASDAAAAYRAAREAGFDNVSLDLIFGWPGQSLAAWEEDLDQILAWGPAPPEHLSLYSLIVEPGTPMADAVARGILVVPDDDATADLYEAAIGTMERAGFIHYEVANWARDERLQARHNLIYWRNGEYAGLGAGAHGHIGGRRAMQHLLPLAWVEAVERGESPVSNVEEIPPQTAMGETMMLGLRLLQQGVDEGAFAARHGVELRERYGRIIEELVGFGLMERTGDGVRLTPRGLMVANDVCARFL
ncbi:MAG: radical SAM family heme chaperone HemW [Chloroflexota bacterium]|nr:radical SAM family heme chaperone HemW [Chloroflexota bacterium]